MKTFILYIFLFIACYGFAQNWTGAVNSDWNNSGNWSSWPLNGQDITIDTINYTGAKAHPVISSASVFSPDRIVVQNTATLTIQNNLTANDRVEILGAGTAVLMQSGNFSLTGSGSKGRLIIGNDAAFTMNSGALNVSQQIVLDLGGSFLLNSGNITVGQTIALADGSTINPGSRFTMNAGTVSLGLDLAFEVETGTFYPAFIMNGGLLTVSGDVSWLGLAPATGSGFWKINGGAATVNGSVLNLTGSTMDMKVQTLNTSSLNINGPAIDMHANDSILPTANSLIILSGTLNWNNNGRVLADANSKLVFNGAASLQGAGKYQFHHVTINLGKSVNHLSPLNLYLSGDFIKNGSFAHGLNTITFNGNSSQIAGGASLNTFNQLLLNNRSTGLQLTAPMKITGSLVLSDGLMTTSAANLLTIDDNATASQGNDSCFVNGPIKKTGDDAFIFPTGKNSKWRRIAMSAPANASAEFIAEYFDAPYTNTVSVTPPLAFVSAAEYWNFVQATGADSVSLSLYWEDASASNISNCSALAMAKWTGSNWQSVSASPSGNCTGNGNGILASDSTQSAYGFFTFGETGLSTSIKEEKKAAAFGIYPNPVNQKSALYISSPLENTKISIVNALGQTVFSKQVNNNSIKLNLEEIGLEAGIYFVVMGSGKDTKTRKLVVSN